MLLLTAILFLLPQLYFAEMTFLLGPLPGDTDRILPLYLLPLTLMQAIIRPRTSYVLRLGPWPNICVEMYSCAFLPHKYIRTTTNFTINTYKLT